MNLLIRLKKAGLIMDGCNVHSVIFGSPAHCDRTLQIGDVVTMIDDKPAGSLSIENLDAYENENPDIALTLIDHQVMY